MAGAAALILSIAPALVSPGPASALPPSITSGGKCSPPGKIAHNGNKTFVCDYTNHWRQVINSPIPLESTSAGQAAVAGPGVAS